MADHKMIIQRLYICLGKRDGAGMASLYHDEATFADPAFGQLDAAQVRAMWQMLCERGKDLRVQFHIVHVDEQVGQCQWQAWYTFSGTGRQVHNQIVSEFVFKDGKIYRQTDQFNFYRWSRQALGPTGWLLGWTGFLQKKVQQQARASLAKYMVQKS
jgi:ketosteroid isomerase-like protein